MHGLCQDQLHQQGDPADVVARHMNQLFSGQVLCSDSPQDGFWLDVLYEAADLLPTFQLKPLEVFVGREAASEIYRLLPTTGHHRALEDATALMSACRAFSNLKLSKWWLTFCAIPISLREIFLEGRRCHI